MRIALVLSLLLVPTVSATQPYYVAPVKQQQVVNYYPQQAALAVFVPLGSYTVGLTAVAAPGVLAEALLAPKPAPGVEAKLDAILKRLEALEANREPGLRLQAGLPAAVERNCAGCHVGEKLKGGFDLANLSAGSRHEAIYQIADGAMPQGRKMSAKERSEVLKFFKETQK